MNSQRAQNPVQRFGVPFGGAALLWAAAALGACSFFATTSAPLQAACFLSIWWVASMDLLSTAKIVGILLRKNRMSAIFQATYWLMIKLGFLTLLGIGLVKFRWRADFYLAVLLGLGSFVVVPLIGGIAWNHLENRREKMCAKGARMSQHA